MITTTLELNRSRKKYNNDEITTGNFYSISNNSKTRAARIFFAQGCEVAAEISADESVVA